MLFTATALETLVTASLAAWVIPHLLHETLPESSFVISVPVLWVVAGLHLAILAVLIAKVWAIRRGVRLRKSGLIVPGIILVMMSMVLTDAAGVYMEHQPFIHSVAGVLFLSAFFDLMTGIIMIMLPIRLREDP